MRTFFHNFCLNLLEMAIFYYRNINGVRNFWLEFVQNMLEMVAIYNRIVAAKQLIPMQCKGPVTMALVGSYPLYSSGQWGARYIRIVAVKQPDPCI